MDILSLCLAGLTGGGFLVIGQVANGMLSNRSSRHGVDRQADVQLDAQQNKLTFDLLAAARADSAAVRQELADHRMVSARAQHLDEALDHLEEILTAEGEIDRKRAEKRARAFLKRMRPTVGDLRQEVQRSDSARELAKRVAGEPEGKAP